MNEPVVYWGILAGIVAFAASVGFFMGRAAARSEGRDASGEKTPWWPEKISRLFWLLSPFLLTLIGIFAGGSFGMETGPLWAVFCAMVIIQGVVGGMFGFHFDLVSSIVCGVFIAVEILMLGGIFLFVVLDYSRFFAWYLVGGILAISGGAVLAAWVGSMPRRSSGRGH